MFKSILVAIDGSEHARKALAVAGELAASQGAALTLIHVVSGARLESELLRMAEVEHLIDDPQEDAAAGRITRTRNDAARDRQVKQALAEKLLAGAKRAAAANLGRVDTVVEEGDPAGRIADYAERNGVDLIVLGSRGLGDLKGLLLGSVSHKVCQLSPCSCITVK